MIKQPRSDKMKYDIIDFAFVKQMKLRLERNRKMPLDFDEFLIIYNSHKKGK